RRLPVERVEAVAEAAEADGVERQRRHVVGDVDLVVGVEAVPLEHELLGDVEHHGVIALHRPLAEARQEDVVGPGPVGLLGVGGEEPVAREVAQPPERPAHALVEARLVTELFHELESRDDHHRLAEHVEPVDGTELLGQLHHVLHGRGGGEREEIAQDEVPRRMRNRVEGVLLRHLAHPPRGPAAGGGPGRPEAAPFWKPSRNGTLWPSTKSMMPGATVLRKSTTCASSAITISGWGTRASCTMIRASSRAGNFGSMLAMSSPVRFSVVSQISDSTAPGKMVLTSIPCAMTSVRSAAENPAMANLLAQ